MKNKLSLIVMMVFITIGLNAQKPFEGFFKPIQKEDINIVNLREYRDLGEFNTYSWIFRPAATVTAVAIDFEGNSHSFSSFGIGLSYGKFTVVDDKPYCNYSFNALLLTGAEIGGEQKTSLGGALTVDVFNKIIGGGIAYIDKKAMLLTTLSYSF
jgi:hypothetical protein